MKHFTTLDYLTERKITIRISCEKFSDIISGYGLEVNISTYKALKQYGAVCRTFEIVDDCAVMTEDYEKNGSAVFITVYPINNDSNVALVTEKELEWAKHYYSIYDDPAVFVNTAVVTNDPLSEEWDALLGWRSFARRGGAFEKDPHVREVRREDIPSLKAFLEPYSKSDDRYAEVAENLLSQLDNDFDRPDRKYKFFGFFEEREPVGVTSMISFNEVGVSWLLDIFVSRSHRRRGIGRALVKSALCERADHIWVYQAAKGNMPSIALAKSLGFEFQGATLCQFVIKDR